MKKIIFLIIILTIFTACENKPDYIGIYSNTNENEKITIILKENNECEYITNVVVNDKVDKNAIPDINKDCSYEIEGKSLKLRYTKNGNEVGAFYKFTEDFNSFTQDNEKFNKES